MTITDLQIDRQNAIKPFVVVRAHASPYVGWLPVVHASYKARRHAEREAEVLMQARCPYCRIERWPNRDGGEVVLREYGVNPGCDDATERGE